MSEGLGQGLILYAHGARDPRWAAPFEAVAARIRAQQPALPLRLAFLESLSPDLAQAASDLLPMFLGPGTHLRRDLPALVQQLRERHPRVCWQLHAAIGEQPAVIDAMASAALQLLGGDRAAGGGSA